MYFFDIFGAFFWSVGCLCGILLKSSPGISDERFEQFVSMDVSIVWWSGSVIPFPGLQLYQRIKRELRS